MTVPEFGSVAEAAELFRCGEKAVYAGVEKRTIPAIKLGKKIRIPLRAIVERLEADVQQGDTPEVEVEGAENDAVPLAGRP